MNYNDFIGHTPGPWVPVEHHGVKMIMTKSEALSDAEWPMSSLSVGFEASDANARLAAAAPSLLARCQELERENKRISDALGQISETIFWPTTLKEYEYFYLKATEMARAALKKG